MMLNLYVQQHQWIVVTLLSGAGLVVLYWLTFHAMHRPRGQEERADEIRITGIGSLISWILSFVPLVLILLMLISVIYTVSHLTWASTRLPNW